MVGQTHTLDQQVRSLERQFVTRGGYSEQLAAARLQEREKKLTDQSDRTDSLQAPNCPLCGSPMALRTAKKGPRPGSQFWGSAKYPACKGTKPV